MYNPYYISINRCVCAPIIPVWSNSYCYLSQEKNVLDQFISDLKSRKPMNNRVIKNITSSLGRIIIFSDKNGQKFVLKQVKPSANPWDKYSLVRETLGSRIAEEMDLPHDRVRMIPPNVKFDLKPWPNLPATLHTFAEGVPIEGVGIQQDTKGGGLSYAVIKNMSKNEDLAKIAALDTFLGNNDRHDWNLHYSRLTKHYTGIDMGDVLHQRLAPMALHQINTLKKEGVHLTPQEIKGLRVYRDTLQHLIQNFPAEKVIKYMVEAEQQSGLAKLGPKNYNRGEVAAVKVRARDNIKAARKLLAALDEILHIRSYFI